MADHTTTTTAPPPPATTGTDWRAQLTGDFAPLATEKSLDSFKGASWTDVGPQLAKAFVETKKLVGTRTDGLINPGDDAAVRKALGVPDAATGYQVQRPQAAALGGWSDDAEKSFLEMAHGAGLPPKAVQAVLNWYGGFVGDDIATATRERAAATAQLRSEWGPNFSANMGLTQRAVQAVDDAISAGGNFIAAFAESALANDPILAKGFHWIGQALAETDAIKTDGLPGLTSPEDAQAQVAKLREELVKTPENSKRAKELTTEIIKLTNIARGRAA